MTSAECISNMRLGVKFMKQRLEEYNQLGQERCMRLDDIKVGVSTINEIRKAIENCDAYTQKMNGLIKEIMNMTVMNAVNGKRALEDTSLTELDLTYISELMDIGEFYQATCAQLTESDKQATAVISILKLVLRGCEDEE